MSDIIRLLPDAIANQIAAGEVVQRPASVVKELMENSIDAGASSIRLLIKEAGRVLIQVKDDGAGMSETDARMSLERHATSKIRTAEDLFTLRTMGFRGEALASIAAVSQFEMKTRPAIRELGTWLVVEGSEVKKQEAVACDAGTTISVKNLFYNIPARRNFLKSNPVEMKHIVDEFQRIALARPDLSFSLIQGDEVVYDLPATKLSQRIIGLFGKSYQQQLAACKEETDLVAAERICATARAALLARVEAGAVATVDDGHALKLIRGSTSRVRTDIAAEVLGDRFYEAATVSVSQEAIKRVGGEAALAAVREAGGIETAPKAPHLRAVKVTGK
jgi:DNA mismatch repair protein MutL